MAHTQHKPKMNAEDFSHSLTQCSFTWLMSNLNSQFAYFRLKLETQHEKLTLLLQALCTCEPGSAVVSSKHDIDKTMNAKTLYEMHLATVKSPLNFNNNLAAFFDPSRLCSPTRTPNPICNFQIPAPHSRFQIPNSKCHATVYPNFRFPICGSQLQIPNSNFLNVKPLTPTLNP